ncbi:type II and III secretion system protein family protein [Novosphingobium tardum]|uniref:Type II and III secretion system protein family protein n=1 Tax=Novosphingobium tardum TaxID=1538021 RepID=A0ABV8RPR9_9SPHN
MKRRLIATLLSAACTLAPLALVPASSASAQSLNRPANDIVLSIGRGQLVTIPGRMSDVFVADESIADVQVKSANQLYVFGKEGGETTVYASNAAGAVIWSANIRVGSNIDSVDQMLHLAMPDAKVNVATMNGTVLLTGTVAAPEDAAEAERLVKAFVTDKTNVISRLRTATPLQVNLQVKFAEVSRSLVRELGVNLLTRDNTSGFQFGIAQGRAGSVSFNADGTKNFVGQAGKTAIAGFGKFLGLDIASALDLAETDGLVTTLSQPNLTALSGETADFLAGGEYPIPISQGLGTTSIEYKKYGVSLAYTPTVLANGRISLRVRPEVSELSSQGAVNLNGFQVPALTIRRAETTIELGSGQSFMIAGLLSNKALNNVSKAPGIGDLPILGSLFRSTSYQKGETELVIVVTPYLVNPVDANSIKLPTDGFRTPNDIQRLLGNMDNAGKSGASRAVPQAVETAPANPQVGSLDAVPAVDPKSGKRFRKGQRSADAGATPGFSLK